MSEGYLALLLHAHLPFVRHPEYEHFLEEDWFYEAVTETYIPLIRIFEKLVEDKVDFRLTMTMSPPLISMLRDDVLRLRYWNRLQSLSELVDKELVRTRFDGHLNYLAQYYRQEIDHAIETWSRHEGDLVKAFGALQDLGKLDIITCGATHGYLPLQQVHPEAVWAQIKVAVDHYRHNFNRAPRGIWLPECAYYPGLDKLLKRAGLHYFVMDSHGVCFAKPRPRYGNLAPIFCQGTGVAAFGRDHESSVQVWSKEHGYPGDFAYREFYRDIGYDLDFDYIRPYIQPTGERKNTGIKYHRITGKSSQKALYDPYQARERTAEHAANFIFNRGRQIEYDARIMGRPPIVLSPYDAELYGHWWYEGPWWIDYVIRKSAFDQNTYRLTHLSEYLEENPTQQVATPAQSSWGDKGYHEFWLNGTNEWIYPHLHHGSEEMIALARDYPQADDLPRRALNQAARELLLAQSSDWAFIMKAGTMTEYAEGRTRIHLRRLLRLVQQVRQGPIDEEWLSTIEFMDNIFPDIDYRVYTPQ